MLHRNLPALAFGLGLLLAACSDTEGTVEGDHAPGATDGGSADARATVPDAATSAHDAAATADAVAPIDASVAGDGAPAKWSCPAGPFGSPLPAGAKATLVAGVPPADGVVKGQGVLEGPLFKDGALYMTHFENHAVPVSRIWKWALGGTPTVFAPDSGANGLAVDSHGDIVAALHSTGAIVRLTGAGAPVTLASSYAGARFNSPNDLAVRDDGTVYFSDPDWQSPSPRPQSKTRVYRVSKTGVVSVVDETRDEPNGVTLSPDGAWLYVSGLDGVFRYDVQTDGSTGAKAPFAPSLGGADGMGVDCAGNLYVAYGASVVVVSPTGAELGRIAVSDAEAVTNVAFGSTDRKTLYITHRGTTQGLHEIALGIPGLPY